MLADVVQVPRCGHDQLRRAKPTETCDERGRLRRRFLLDRAGELGLAIHVWRQPNTPAERSETAPSQAAAQLVANIAPLFRYAQDEHKPAPIPFPRPPERVDALGAGS